MSSIHLISDHSEQVRVTPANLLDELSVNIKDGEVKVQELLIVYLTEDGGLTILSTPMPRYMVMGLLGYASHLEANDV